MSQKPDMTLDEANTAFHQFLCQHAGQQGFAEPKRSQWIDYMFNPTRGETIVEHLIATFNPKQENRKQALDIGCGFGGLMIALEKYYSAVSGIDIVEERVTWARKRAGSSDVRCCSATKLPWSDNTFDLIISTDVLEHFNYAPVHQ
jgi:2-polyprenyl-3-methyl-5-hydroxy-6-metoxy-1,4-benzoquinol methylase